MQSKDLWGVRLTAYQTYKDIEINGEIKTKIIVTEILLEQAKKLVEQLGFGYSCFPMN